MSIPVIGDIRNFYCKCIEKKISEFKSEFKQDNSGLTQHHVATPSPSTTSWICKCKRGKSWEVSTGIFSSKTITQFQYYWECMNCGKKTSIGIWDNEGNSYGDD